MSAPRRCKTASGKPKAAYPTVQQLGNNAAMHAYHCTHCGGYHVGHGPRLPRGIPAMSSQQNRRLNARRRSHA